MTQGRSFSSPERSGCAPPRALDVPFHSSAVSLGDFRTHSPRFAPFAVHNGKSRGEGNNNFLAIAVRCTTYILMPLSVPDNGIFLGAFFSRLAISAYAWSADSRVLLVLPQQRSREISIR
jgi:uncharacterized membrane protein SpoIIM required for sporulation